MKLYEWCSRNTGENSIDFDLVKKAEQLNIERGKYYDE